MSDTKRPAMKRRAFETLERRDLLAITPANVLVLYNTASTEGAQIANYYAQAHPGVQLLGITGVNPANEEITADAYLSTIRPQVVSALSATTDVIVTTKGLPLRVNITQAPLPMSSTYVDGFGVTRTVWTWKQYSSLESELTRVDTISTWQMMGDQSYFLSTAYSRNPYYVVNGPFSYATYGTRLTSRLDGFSLSDVQASIDRAGDAVVGADHSPNQPFYFLVDNDPTKTYSPTMSTLATNVLGPKGMPVVYDNTSAFVNTAPGPIIGYDSHGVHQLSTPADYINGLNVSLADGAVFMSWESYNAYSFNPAANPHGNQGQIGQWLQKGGTAGVGNVEEPGASPSNVTNDDQLFKMLLNGYTFAEAAWSATRQLSFVNTVVGDPLMTWQRLPQDLRPRLFYDGSGFDGGVAGVNPTDDGAIATDKVAYWAGSGTAGFANVSSYSKGINGLMIDIAGTHPGITANDFTFRVGNDNYPATWPLAASPTGVVVRAGAGVAGSDRVELIWPTGTIRDTWLEITVKANGNTGLASPKTFYFGSMVGDTGLGNESEAAYTDSTDIIATRLNIGGDLNDVTSRFDYNRDNHVDSTDQIIVRISGGGLDMLCLGGYPSAGPTSQEPDENASDEPDGYPNEEPQEYSSDPGQEIGYAAIPVILELGQASVDLIDSDEQFEVLAAAPVTSEDDRGMAAVASCLAASTTARSSSGSELAALAPAARLPVRDADLAANLGQGLLTVDREPSRRAASADQLAEQVGSDDTLLDSILAELRLE